LNTSQRVIKFLRSVKDLLLDPGIQAVVLYRASNWLYRKHVLVVPQILQWLNQFITNAYIAPAATIGPNFTIKHSVGIVIGATSVIEDHVTIFHGVTLGSTDISDEGKRHPTIKSGVLIGAGAILLGNITIGEQTIIGAGAVVVEDVPPNSVVVGPKATIRSRVLE
jgi:serine O-acetyltransferase